MAEGGTYLSVVPFVVPTSPDGEALVSDIRGARAAFDVTGTGGAPTWSTRRLRCSDRFRRRSAYIGLATFVLRPSPRRWGVAPALYLHFAEKDEPFFECCHRRFVEMAEHMEAAARDRSSALDALEAMGRAYIEFGRDRGEQYEVMFLHPIPDPMEGLPLEEMPGTQALVMTARGVAAGIASGELRSDLDPQATSVSLWSACDGVVMVLLSKRRNPSFPMPEEQSVIDHTETMIRRGLEA